MKTYNQVLKELAEKIIKENNVNFEMNMEKFMLLVMKYHRPGINILNIRNEWLFSESTYSILNKGFDFKNEKQSNEYQFIIHKIFSFEKKYNHEGINNLIEDLTIRMSNDLCDSLITLQHKPYFQIDIQDITLYEYFSIISNFNGVVKSIRQKQNEEVEV